ncbi:ketopantoate reductase family protein [Sutcliffiella rhizosphaerae]|uniref:2-dehydropantoate 2-reductase n=1 Tax=Sutcliffiella rhizosphaerae TaxID=2880967 RepID=A0ABN8AB35_9BACI|nr:ketopantoate reductase family protein [Sutcliffiella rhizosphaerae]CAG9621257.1 2-dehydropantoate 2-reductase [Sutcliffiella rhizosphaerae]
MRVLVVGAGAVGGYFGGRLLEKGEDVTFLVRNRRKEQLLKTGLVIKSQHGDALLRPQLLVSGEQPEPYDVILLSMKAYQLDAAISDIAPYVGADTLIIPLLNGMAHVEKLAHAFGKETILGGLCFVEATLDQDGAVVQTSAIHDLVFGIRNGEQTERIKRITEAFSETKSNFVLSDNINQAMWQKYLFITTLAGITTLFRSPLGPIRDESLGALTMKQTLQEAEQIMRSIGAPLGEEIVENNWDKLHSIEATIKSSMQRDMEKGLPVEADHFYGYLLNIAKENGIAAPTLEKIYANLKIYERQMGFRWG